MDFRGQLQTELERRCAKNPGYSLRAFATQLKVNPATLSQYLRGKRKMTAPAVRAMGSELGFAPHELERLCKTAAPDRRRKKVRTPFLQYQPLSIDAFNAASEWQHDAILELTHLKCFRPEPKWIARTLGLTVSEIHIAVERLQKLGLLEIQGRKWVDLSPMTSLIIGPEANSVAMKKYQKAVLEKARAAVDDVAKTQRDHTSIMLTLRKGDLPRIKEKITALRRELAGFIGENRAEHDEVYQIAFSLFPVSRVQPNQEKSK